MSCMVCTVKTFGFQVGHSKDFPWSQVDDEHLAGPLPFWKPGGGKPQALGRASVSCTFHGHRGHLARMDTMASALWRRGFVESFWDTHVVHGPGTRSATRDSVSVLQNLRGPMEFFGTAMQTNSPEYICCEAFPANSYGVFSTAMDWVGNAGKGGSRSQGYHNWGWQCLGMDIGSIPWEATWPQRRG